MPIKFEDCQTPSGMKYLRADVTGNVELEDGEALAAQLLRPEHNRGKVLSVVSKGVVYSPQVRKFFPTLIDKYHSLAAVVTSPIVKAAINLMLRVTPSSGGIARMFSSEAEALQWLERQG